MASARHLLLSVVLLPVFSQGQITCSPGEAVIGPWTAYWTPGPPAPTTNNPDITPFTHSSYARVRRQYLFRPEELDFLQNGGIPGPCAGYPIDSLAFYVTDSITSGDQKPYAWRMLLKHSTLTVMNLFDETPDTAARCAVSNDAMNGLSALPDGSPMLEPGLGGPGWRTFRFPDPFVWNGTDAIIIEFCYSSTLSVIPAPQIWCTVPVITGISSSYSHRATNTAGPCALTGDCGAASIAGCGMDITCGMQAGDSRRPVVRFNGVVSSISTGAAEFPPTSALFWFDPAGERIVVPGAWAPPMEYAVHDGSGRLVADGVLASDGIDAGALPDGLYMVRVTGVEDLCQRVMVVR